MDHPVPIPRLHACKCESRYLIAVVKNRWNACRGRLCSSCLGRSEWGRPIPFGRSLRAQGYAAPERQFSSPKFKVRYSIIPPVLVALRACSISAVGWFRTSAIVVSCSSSLSHLLQHTILHCKYTSWTTPPPRRGFLHGPPGEY